MTIDSAALSISAARSTTATVRSDDFEISWLIFELEGLLVWSTSSADSRMEESCRVVGEMQNVSLSRAWGNNAFKMLSTFEVVSPS